MRCRVAVEDIEPRHYVCWGLDLPGCFSSATRHADAVAQVPVAVADYFSWIRKHDPTLPAVAGPYTVDVVEVFRSRPSSDDPEYVVNAFFADDERPLSYWDVEGGLRLLDWSRQDLLELIERLSAEELQRPIENEVRGNIAGILEHVAGTENWYLDQLGLSIERSELPCDVSDKLEVVRSRTRSRLTHLLGDDRITENHGERWSARKVLRRTLWHERDHTQHISALAAGFAD